jgi:2-polyprenyl-3-methyl-5-hydroxy-6-metoxy-1,4-benzoquinol methylase
MQPAKPIIVKSMKRLNPISVLDLGCGKCAFSQKFINKGINVTGVDKEFTAESHDNFTFVQQDILDFEFEPKYDLIIGTGILHFLKKEDAHQLIKKMQENTLPGGFHFLICMSNKENPNDRIHFYPNRKVLSKLYSGWEIIHNAPCLSKKHGETMQQHKMIIILAKKI